MGIKPCGANSISTNIGRESIFSSAVENIAIGGLCRLKPYSLTIGGCDIGNAVRELFGLWLVVR